MPLKGIENFSWKKSIDRWGCDAMCSTCAIIDKNAVGEVWGRGRGNSPAGQAFAHKIQTGEIHVAVGGGLRQELEGSTVFQIWARDAALAGIVHYYNDNQVDEKTEKLKNADTCVSNDQHVIALAQISGARLLYTNDKRLQRDFGNPRLIAEPPGVIFTTNDSKNLTEEQEALLNDGGLPSCK